MPDELLGPLKTYTRIGKVSERSWRTGLHPDCRVRLETGFYEATHVTGSIASHYPLHMLEDLAPEAGSRMNLLYNQITNGLQTSPILHLPGPQARCQPRPQVLGRPIGTEPVDSDSVQPIICQVKGISKYMDMFFPAPASRALYTSWLAATYLRARGTIAGNSMITRAVGLHNHIRTRCEKP